MNRKMKTMDGNNAAAHASYAYTDVAAIYPITPSSTMAEVTDAWAVQGRKNIFGEEVQVTEMQSEAGAAGAVHGALAAGALSTTYTASQGLLLMIPNLYKVAGERLPGVFNVSARTIASHALSIFGDHSDIYSCRQTGVAMLASSSVQEVMDITPAAHCAAIEGRIPFINFFDGFRTSHEVQKIETWDYEDLKDMLNEEALDEYRKSALNPNKGKLMGSAQNPDIFFQVREACNKSYDELPAIVEKYLDKINEKIGTNYKLFNYYGAPDAEHIVVAMGSACETLEETVDYLNANGEKVGFINVHLYRPFSIKSFVNAIPDSVKQITILDRTKEPGAAGEPLFLDVVAALNESKFKDIPLFSGRYGLSSKDTTPAHFAAVYKNNTKKIFTVGIVDDVTNLSLEVGEELPTVSSDITCCKFFGLGADGTVGANKNSIKVIGDNTDMYVQAYFEYDSKKSGGVTISHLRFGHSKIKSTYLVNKADFVACHNPSYIDKYDMVQSVKDGGTFLLSSIWSKEELNKALPGQVKKYIIDHNIKFYIINGVEIAKELGLDGRINTILQAAFFQLSKIIDPEKAKELLKAAAEASYSKKGDKVVQMNFAAIDRGFSDVEAVDYSFISDTSDEKPLYEKATKGHADTLDFVNTIQKPINALKGKDLPVSAFVNYADGITPSGTSAYEKRCIAIDIPEWIPENCIQCNRCSYVCPHAVIRPFALTQDEIANAPSNLKTMDMVGMPEYKFAMTLSAMDCTGCGSCVAVCPGKKGVKALEMKTAATQLNQQEVFDYVVDLDDKTDVVLKFKETSVKGSQFKKPYLEFSGACAGCGETAYAKLITQLFGDRMYIANATGCSSIWGNSSPSTPYTTNKAGQGPVWSNSLFEDAAEFGFGMNLAQQAIRNGLKTKVGKLAEETTSEEVKAAIAQWLDTYFVGATNGTATDKLVEAIKDDSSETAKYILHNKEFLAKKSQWIFGGDGWAYDIGFGGLDHVIASGQDVNILVFDTEVYSNTGGQASKSTPTGAIAQFAAGGKEGRKKDLASIAMSYGNVYVASIAMGADYNQAIKAISEAEAYQGPSVIIAYAPCINHGIKGGMGNARLEDEKAVKSGYWHCFRFNPDLLEEGKAGFILDSKAPTEDFKEFIGNEVRYSSLVRNNPEKAKELFDKAEKNSKYRNSYLNKLVTLYGQDEN